MDSGRGPSLGHTARHFRKKFERSPPPQRKGFVLRMAGRRRTQVVGGGDLLVQVFTRGRIEGIILLTEV